MRYNNPSQQPTTGSIIGDTTDAKAATTAQFAAFWGELAGRFASNEKVIFGLMNEVCISFNSIYETRIPTSCSLMTWTPTSFSQMIKLPLMLSVRLAQINCKTQNILRI